MGWAWYLINVTKRHHGVVLNAVNHKDKFKQLSHSLGYSTWCISCRWLFH